jgi:hypothetical protein
MLFTSRNWMPKANVIVGVKKVIEKAAKHLCSLALKAKSSYIFVCV